MTVPALPDSDRLTSYTVVSASVGPYNVGFDIYADDDDYGQFVEVWDDGVKLTAVTDWTLDSAAGGSDLSIIARPITDARITFTVARSGAIKIVGARRPRQASQFINGQSITADQHNRRYTDLMAICREFWDKFKRALLAPPGEMIGPLPSAADRASKFLGFDVNGDPIATSTGVTGVPALASAIENDSGVPGDSVADALDFLGAGTLRRITAAGGVTAAVGEIIVLDKTVPATTTVTLPTDAENGQSIIVKDGAGNAVEFPATLSSASHDIEQLDGETPDSTSIIDIDGFSIRIVFDEQGAIWRFI